MENLVGKLDSNLYGMKKIFDSIGHLLDEGESIGGQGQNNINNNNNDGINSTKQSKRNDKNRQIPLHIEAKTIAIDFRPFLTSSS